MSEKTKTEPTAAGSIVPQATKTLEFVEPEDGIIRTYANHHRYGWTSYDIRFYFGEIVEVTDDKIVIEETVQLTMSWQQAKELLATLQGIVAQEPSADSSQR